MIRLKNVFKTTRRLEIKTRNSYIKAPVGGTMPIKIYSILLIISVMIIGCDPIVTEFDSKSKPVKYEASSIISVTEKAEINVITWNIRFGAARLPWFGDSCGERVMLTEKETLDGLEKVALKINELDPDIIFLQEVDTESKRTGYIDQVQWLLDHTDLNYGVYASMWDAQVIPSDGLGRVETGNAILSKWELSDAVRHQLSLREDQAGIVQLFYLRRNALVSTVNMGTKTFSAVSVHSTAFATDDTKKKHMEEFIKILDDLDASEKTFIAGGDLNSLPPNAAKTEYCAIDYCEKDEFTTEKLHNKDEHREGSYFSYEKAGSLEKEWINDLYSKYTPAVSLADYSADEDKYFTHTPDFSKAAGWDRKLDYLFTNGTWVAGSDSTHQEAVEESDHIPVSARWVVQ